MTIALVIIGIIACIAASAFFSGTEMAMSSCNQIRLENEAKSGSKKSGRALKLTQRFDDTLSAILVGNNLVNIAASSLTTVLIILLTDSDRMTWLGTLIVTVLIIIFGETLPKILCKKSATRVSSSVSGLMQLLIWLFKPISALVVWIVSLLTRRLKEQETADEEESARELQSIIETAEDEGVLDSDRSELVSAAIDFQDIAADEVMTARVDVQALDIEDSPEEMILKVMESSHSRLPVYEGSIDNVIGIVHLNHLLKSLSEHADADLRSILMKPVFIYKTTKLPAALKTLRSARQHLAIVTDEYSGTLGVISMEDILEQIVGEIWDETDTVEQEVVERSAGELEIDGDMVIGDFLKIAELSEDDFEYESGTVGGWTIEYLERFPQVGDQFHYDHFTVTVTQMDERRVEKLLIRMDPEPAAEEE